MFCLIVIWKKIVIYKTSRCDEILPHPCEFFDYSINFEKNFVVTSQSERQWKLLKLTTNSFIIYFDGISRLKLWSLLSSLALISASHTGKQWYYICWSWLMSWREERMSLKLMGNVQVNHVSDVKKSKNKVEFNLNKKNYSNDF